jgi:hypothetical protein
VGVAGCTFGLTSFGGPSALLGTRHGEICNCKDRWFLTADNGFISSPRRTPNITEKMTFRNAIPVRKYVEFKRAKIK